LKTKTLLIVFLLGSYLNIFGQRPIINLTFTKNYTISNSKIDSIKVMNMSNNEYTMLYWPDTTLKLDYIDGIGDYINNNQKFLISQNYPNPISDKTTICLHIPNKGIVTILITDISGQNSIKSRQILEKGHHSFSFIPGKGQVFILTTIWNNKIESIKILSQKNKNSNANSLIYLGKENSSTSLKNINYTNNFTYKYGDSLLFVGYSKLGNINIGSDIIIDSPLTNEVYKFNITEGIPCYDTPVVNYEGMIYNTIKINNQCWLKENLNVGVMIDTLVAMQDNDVIEKYCIKNSEDSCYKYGGLYNWNEIIKYSFTNGPQGICPSGWHIPSDNEWKILEGSVDSEYSVGDPEWDNIGIRGSDVGTKLKSKSEWILDGSGDNTYGFSALPAGEYSYNFHGFESRKGLGVWWTSSYYLNYAFYHALNYQVTKSSRGVMDKNQGLSIRCIKD